MVLKNTFNNKKSNLTTPITASSRKPNNNNTLLNFHELTLTKTSNKYVAPFYVNEIDLSQNISLNIHNLFEYLYDYFELKLTFHLMTIGNHRMIALTPIQKHKLQRKAYYCLVGLRTILLLDEILETILKNNIKLQKIKKEINDVKSKLLQPIDFDFISNIKHPNKLQELDALTKIISDFQGLIYKTLSTIEVVFKQLINQKFTQITSESSQTEEQKTPITFIRDLYTKTLYELTPNTIKTNKNNTFVPFTNDLNIISKLLNNPFSSDFLKDNKKQKKTLNNLKKIFHLVINLFFYYNLFVTDTSLEKSLCDLLPSINNKYNIKLPYSLFPTLLSLPKFDNSSFGEITKAITKSTLEISLLGLNFLNTHRKTWVLNYNNKNYPFENKTLESITMLSNKLQNHLSLQKDLDVGLINNQNELHKLSRAIKDSSTMSMKDIADLLSNIQKNPIVSENNTSKEDQES